MSKYLKIQGWTVDFFSIYKVEDNKIILQNQTEIILNKKEKEILRIASSRLGLPNFFEK
jgi:energy-converting hydrogenase A subunit M